MPTETPDRYTIISADTHAGGSHREYREYLDPEWRDEFDAWREKYKNPWKDLRNTDLRIRNWDDERRDADQLADGVVGEVLFPNTVPPFYPGFILFAGPPKEEDYARRRAGLQAHNRWMVDFQGRRPERRAGIGQTFLNDIDHAIEDTTWIKEHGLKGGVLLPTVAPDVKWVRPLYDPEYDRLWAVCQDLDIPVHLHGGTGSPDYGRYAAVPMIMIAEVPFYGMRNFVHMLLGGVFERFPRLKFVITEAGASQFVSLLAAARRDHRQRAARARSASSSTRRAPPCPARPPSTSSRTCGSAPASPARPTSRPATSWARTASCGAATTRTTRAPVPTPARHLRQVMHDLPEDELRKILGDERREALRLRHGRARSAGRAVRADGRGGPPAARRAARRARTARCCGHAATASSPERGRRSASPARTPSQVARRERIIRAATELLEEREYERIQIRHVADAASVALGTLYRYFPSKEQLYAEVLLTWSESFEHAGAGAEPPGGDRCRPVAGGTAADGSGL